MLDCLGLLSTGFLCFTMHHMIFCRLSDMNAKDKTPMTELTLDYSSYESDMRS